MDGNKWAGLPRGITTEAFTQQVQGETAITTPADIVRRPASILEFGQKYSESDNTLGKILERSGDLEKSFRVLQADHRDLKAEIRGLEDRVVDLEHDSKRYQAVILSYVVDRVHSKVQQVFGAKPEDKTWEDYIVQLCHRQQNIKWFIDRNLLSNMSLLYKTLGQPCYATSCP